MSATLAMMIGDYPVRDIKGAHGASPRGVWVNRDGRTLHPREPRPDLEVSGLADLLALLLPTAGAALDARGRS